MSSIKIVEGTAGITRRTALQLGAAAAALGLGPTIAQADTYPDGPITVIIPLPPGGVLDVFARAASDVFQRDLKHPFVVENVPGATSNLGVSRVARSNPDGRTVVLTVSAPVSTNPFVIKDMPFDTDKDLRPVILTAVAPIVLTVHKSFPGSNVKEYLDYAKAHPGELAFGTSGVGSPHHLCGEYLASVADVKLNHIPYKGTPESAADVIAGHIPSAFTALGLVLEQAKAGNVKLLAITDDKRNAAFPDIATIGETVPKFVHAPAAWNAMFVPVKTPDAIVDTLNKEMNVVLKDQGVLEQMQKLFLFPLGGTPDDVTQKRHFEQDITRTLAGKIGLVPQ
jgi:tripartite-type tricarboxylate transporter receptor subunit TctC